MNSDNQTKQYIDPRLLPSVSNAVDQYHANNKTISQPCSFGVDPLQNLSKKTTRFDAFTSHYSFQTLFFEVSNGCTASFVSALNFFIDITYRLSVST